MLFETIKTRFIDHFTSPLIFDRSERHEPCRMMKDKIEILSHIFIDFI